MDIDDDEEEMGEMVAPSDEVEEERRANSSDEEDMISPEANERRRSSLGVPDPDLMKGPSRSPVFDQESEGRDAEFQDEESGSSGEEGDELVEISMPVNVGDGRRNSMGRG